MYFKRIQVNTDVHTFEVFKKSSLAIIVKVIGMVCGIVLSVLVARMIGAEGLGIISLSNKIAAFILIIGLVGMPSVIIKEVAIAKNKNESQPISDVMHTAYWFNGLVMFSISVITILLSPWLVNVVFKKPALLYPLIIMISVTTPQAFSRILSSGMKGIKKIWQSSLVDNTLSSLISLLLLSIIWWLQIEITIEVVASVYAIGRVIVTIVAGLHWKQSKNNNRQFRFNLKEYIRTALPLYIVSIARTLTNQFDIIILAFFADPIHVGLYAVASRLALLIVFALNVTLSTVSPKIAYLYASGKKTELETMIQKTTKISGVISLIPMIIYLIFGHYILGLWGPQFISAFHVLIILSLGQVINVLTGSVGQILIMTGEEVLQSKITIIFAVYGLIQSIIAGHLYGIIGIAYSQTINIVLVNIVKSVYVYKRRNIDMYGLYKRRGQNIS